MKRYLLLLAALAVGCSRADVEVLNRISQKVGTRASAVLDSDASRKVRKSLPPLLPDAPAEAKPTPANDAGASPRLNVE